MCSTDQAAGWNDPFRERYGCAQVTAFSNSEEVAVDKVNVSIPLPAASRKLCICPSPD